MNMHRNLLRTLTGDDSELVLQFFVAFSRFEYALKRAGFVREDQIYAAPDWNTFAREKGITLLNDTTDRKFIDAREFLLGESPRRQIVESDGSLGWQPNRQGRRESDAEYLLRLVRDVRNNLFHGGKYPNQAVSGKRLRNSRLLEACVTILEKCLSLDDDVKHAFEFLYDE